MRIVGHERHGAVVVAHVHTELGDAPREHVHHVAPTAHADELRAVAARCGSCLLDERPGLLAARPDQAVVGGRLDRPLGDVRVAVLDALRGQPFVVGQAVVGIPPHLGLVGIRTAGHEQVPVQVLGPVLETCGALDRRAAAAAEIDLAARQRARPAVARGRLEQGHLRARSGRFDRRAGARGAKADDDHVGLDGPARHLAQRAWPVERELRHGGHRKPHRPDVLRSRVRPAGLGNTCPRASRRPQESRPRRHTMTRRSPGRATPAPLRRAVRSAAAGRPCSTGR